MGGEVRGRRGEVGGGCRAYLFTYELVQTQVDVDMPQMPAKQSHLTVAFRHQPSVLIIMYVTFRHYEGD